MKVYKGLLTGTAALALLFSMIFMGCESPTDGMPGRNGVSVPNNLTLVSDVSVVAPGGGATSSAVQYEFRAFFKDVDVSADAKTRWEVKGDGLYTNTTNSALYEDGHHKDTTIKGPLGADGVSNGAIQSARLAVSEFEESETLTISASHGGYTATKTVTLGARVLPGIGLTFDPLTSPESTTRILLDWQPGNRDSISTQPDFGYYFVYTVGEKAAMDVKRSDTIDAAKAVNVEEDIPVKNGDWITVYEVPQDALKNTTIHGYVNLQVHTTAKVVRGQENLYEPQIFFNSPTTAFDLETPDRGVTTIPLVSYADAPTILTGYDLWVIDPASWTAQDKDAVLKITSGVKALTGTEAELPTVGIWRLLAQHKETKAWWDIDTVEIRHNTYSKASEKKPEHNILKITVTGGKKLIEYTGISLNGIPFTEKPLSKWDIGKDANGIPNGNTSIELYLGDLDLNATGAPPAGNWEGEFVSGGGGGATVQIPYSHFAEGTAPVKADDPDVKVSWGIDSTIRGVVDVRGIKLDDDEVSVVQVVDRYKNVITTEHYNFEWYYVDGRDWKRVTQSADVPAHEFHPDGTEHEQAAKKYLGLKVRPKAGYSVHLDSEFVFGKFTD
jgi:hypothetical protein